MHDHDHDHAKGTHVHSGIECCAHHDETNSERWILAYMFGGVLVSVTLLLQTFSSVSPEVAKLPAMIGSVLLSLRLLHAAFTELSRRDERGRLKLQPGTSCLAALAVVAAIAMGEYVTAGLLAFILLVFSMLVRRAAFGAQRAIEELIGLTPDIARIVGEDGTEQEIDLEQVRVGQVVRVRAGENLPVDGTIITGRSSINQASLTGEAVPVEVQPGSDVYAGTTNLTGGIDIRVTQVGAETTIGKVSQLISEAENTRTPRQALIEQVAGFFVPVALTVAGIVWFLKSQSDDLTVQREAALDAVTVLIVCCPAALLLASPSAMVAAFASAARLGVMIKSTDQLERAAGVDAVVFDKTGTLTTGRFGVSKLVPAPGVEGVDLLTAAVNGEQHSNHPLAQSIIDTAVAARITPDGTQDYEELHGRGVRARTSKGEVCVGRASWLVELNPSVASEIEAVESKIEGMTGVHVMRDGKYMGVVGLEDKVRPQTKTVIARLRELGVRTIAIFTGDRISVAKRVALTVGADAIEAECLPEEKHEQIQEMVGEGFRVMMIGDGINDGPSLAAADVGVAMGLSGSDIAANSAGVALMTDDLSRIPFLMELSRKTRSIIAQNIAASILIVVIGLVLSSMGWLDVWLAGLYHFAGEIFVLLNSFRLFRFGEGYAHADQGEQTHQRREASVRGLGASAPQTA